MDTVVSLLLTIFGAKAIIIMLLLSAFVILVLIILGIKSKNSLFISFGPVKVNVGKTTNVPSLVSAILEAQENTIRKIFQIESDLTKRQLVYTEQMLYQVKYVLSDSFIQMLSQKVPPNTDVKTTEEYKFQQRISTILFKEIKDIIFESAFVDNHFESMSGQIWEDYIEDKSLYVLNFIGDFFDSFSEIGTLLTRQQVSESEHKAAPKIKDVIHQIFDRARDMSIASKKDIENTRVLSKRDIKAICKSIFGVDFKENE